MASKSIQAGSPFDPSGPAVWGWCGLIVVALVGVALRHHEFAAVHSWFDESLGWRMAQFPPGEIIDRSERNVHPPGHFLLLSAWRGLFGGSLSSLRYYSLLWGIGTVVGGYALARAALSGRTAGRDQPERGATDRGRSEFGGVLAALLIALSPLHIHWSQQVKMYALGTCLTVWSTWFLLRWFQSGGTYRLACYVVLAAALALQHHYGTFTVFGQLTFALCWSGWRSWRGVREGDFLSILITGWATASLWSLWLPSFLIQRALVKRSYWIGEFSWQDVINVWGRLLVSHTSLPAADTTCLVIAELVLASVLMLLVHRGVGARMVGWLVLVPYGVAAAWSVADQNVMVPRYLINAHVCLLAGAAILIASIPVAAIRYLVAFVAIVGTGYLGYQQRLVRSSQAALPGMSAAVETLREVRAADEPVLVCNPMLYLNVCVHNEGLSDVYAFDPGHGFPHFQGAPVMRDDEYLSLSTVEEGGRDWVWTLDAEDWLGGNWKVRLPDAWHVQEEKRIREWYGTLVIRAYRRNGSSPQEGDQ
ncbi:hypothetical protein Mal4_17800 [Maioricimonas rarisocia]|uniref:Glycosyltransferase RgtA/B/C/D-like domain-containing protein n=1 Tax=Maioricimonas rarisocia TaxID=2528026 RepID=A0A517Z4Q6_9PLAN|nr:hypothetical protein [Maioricimonas rarisocia]QDU37466.1 hypothetical protein Mal4_17800 [Maioricimonas rarisocia]